MKYEISPLPDPLVFGKGADQFSLHLKRITGEERMAILDAADAGSMQQIQLEIERVITGWDNVLDSSGNPVLFKYEDDGVQMTRLADFLGMIPMAMHYRIVAAIMAFVGIPTKDVEEIVKRFETGKKDVSLAPTVPPDGDMPTNASGG